LIEAVSTLAGGLKGDLAEEIGTLGKGGQVVLVRGH
jgi:hypothetical protein